MAIQARTEFASALNQVCSERGLEPAVVIDSIKQAILAAYRKDYGEPEGILIDLNEDTGEVQLSRDKKLITPPGFGRIAAQTAKQVILQRIREAEKNAILSEYSSKIETIVSGIVQRISGPVITINLGKAEGIMPPQEQAHEKYFVNQRLKFFVVGIKEGTRGEEIIVSRVANGLLEGLFKQEVPEINSGAVEAKATAREAGSRSKIAVFSNQMGVDPVGSCVGQKGVRVQAVINELGDEKIDVIAYQEDPAEFIKAALSPAKDLQVKVNEKEKIAEVTAPDDQLSLAIGKEGQNVRLAAKLTGYKIDIRGKSGTPKEVEEKEKKAQEEAKKALGIEEEPKKESAKDSKVEKSKERKVAQDLAQSKKPERSEEKEQVAEKKEKGTIEKTSAMVDQPATIVSDDQDEVQQSDQKQTPPDQSVITGEAGKKEDKQAEDPASQANEARDSTNNEKTEAIQSDDTKSDGDSAK